MAFGVVSSCPLEDAACCCPARDGCSQTAIGVVAVGTKGSKSCFIRIIKLSGWKTCTDRVQCDEGLLVNGGNFAE